MVRLKRQPGLNRLKRESSWTGCPVKMRACGLKLVSYQPTIRAA